MISGMSTQNQIYDIILKQFEHSYSNYILFTFFVKLFLNEISIQI